MSGTDKDSGSWKPPRRVRAIAIAIVETDGRFLMKELRDGDGTLTGLRLPGGAIAFGETAVETLHRTFRKEFGWQPDTVRMLGVVENLFDHGGAPGHEIVFLHRAGVPAEIDRAAAPAAGARWVERAELAELPVFPAVAASLGEVDGEGHGEGQGEAR